MPVKYEFSKRFSTVPMKHEKVYIPLFAIR
jgi:hypothetical protein